FRLVEGAKVGVELKPPIDGPAADVGEGEAAAQKQASNGSGAAVAGNELAAAIDVRGEGPQHGEFVGDDLGVGKEAAGDGLEGVAEVGDDEADVLATRDVRELRFHLADAAALDEFH